jgi:PucR-like helix-turn-helix protein/diguanylate cyclase with GGDEF domain
MSVLASEASAEMVHHGALSRVGARNGKPARVPAEQLAPVREVAVALLPRAGEIAAGMARSLHELVPELRVDPGPELFEETRAMWASNVGQILRMLSAGEPLVLLSVPPEATEYTRSLVRRGVPLAALLREYHLGQDYFLDEWTHALTERTRDRVGLGAALTAVARWLSGYVDRVCDHLVVEYGAASEQWSRSVAALRADTARSILAGTLQDELEGSRRLGYELRRDHVALVVWRVRGYPLDAAELMRVASSATEALGAVGSLVVEAGTAELWVWCPRLQGTPEEIQDALESLDIEEGVGVATGRRAAGLEGFRRTHMEAVAAARVASLAREPQRTVTSYHAVELIALLSADLGSARAFVRNELGDLAGPGAHAEQLRETVLAFLEEGMSNRRAGRRLYCHQNTVAYRMARARELLGRPLEDRRTELVAALTLTTALGASVLEDETP